MAVIRNTPFVCTICGEEATRGASWIAEAAPDGGGDFNRLRIHVCTTCAYRALPRIVADGMTATGYRFWDVESKVLREFYKGLILARERGRESMLPLGAMGSTGDTTSGDPDPLEPHDYGLCDNCGTYIPEGGTDCGACQS
jgi:hypothetical protein